MVSTRRSWIDLAILSVSAAITVAAADYLFHFVAPPKHFREVEDGVRDLRQGNPTVLIVGSSHARTFHAVGQELSRRTGGAENLVAVPIEYGKLFAYDSLLQRHLLPIVDQPDASGAVAKNRLRRFVLVTEWWDSCGHGDGKPYWNLPARAWEVGDFAKDLLQKGINGYNRNYLQNRFRMLFPESALVYDRTQRVILPTLARVLRGKPLRPTADEELRLVEEWKRMVERGAACIGDPVQMASLRDTLGLARSRQWETTVILFPRKPATLTETAKSTTLAVFARQVRAMAEPLGATVIDLTYRSPLTDADFMDDFDHVTEEGNVKFAHWVLDHDLKFLLAPLAAAGLERAGR